MNLKEFQKKYHIRRIDFAKIKPTNLTKEYAEDALICPYCKNSISYESDVTNDILDGTPFQCHSCGKWFYADGEITINTTCTPIEDKILEYKKYIERDYQYMDECDKKGCEWDAPYGVVEYGIYKGYAEPLFENMKEK